MVLHFLFKCLKYLWNNLREDYITFIVYACPWINTWGFCAFYVVWHRGSEHGLWIAWVWMPAWSLTSCVFFVKLFDLSVPQFPHCKLGYEVKKVKYLEQHIQLLIYNCSYCCSSYDDNLHIKIKVFWYFLNNWFCITVLTNVHRILIFKYTFWLKWL